LRRVSGKGGGWNKKVAEAGNAIFPRKKKPTRRRATTGVPPRNRREGGSKIRGSASFGRGDRLFQNPSKKARWGGNSKSRLATKTASFAEPGGTLDVSKRRLRLVVICCPHKRGKSKKQGAIGMNSKETIHGGGSCPREKGTIPCQS